MLVLLAARLTETIKIRIWECKEDVEVRMKHHFIYEHMYEDNLSSAICREKAVRARYGI